VYPPEGQKWHPRRNLAATSIVTAPNGKEVCIGEIRGWLHTVEDKCNDIDPDWHYLLVIDPAWLDAVGIPLELYLLPGDVIVNQGFSTVPGEVEWRSSVRAQYSEAFLVIELDGWPPNINTARGQPAQPNDWVFTNECNNQQTFWPYNPLNPKPGDSRLEPGQYVRIVGSLVSDDPHMMSDQLATNSVLRLGYEATVSTLGKERADVGQFNAIKWLWGEQLADIDERHPARWNEIHSPDYIEVLSTTKNAQETVRCITVVAQNGLFAGDIEGIAANIPAPARPSRWHTLAYRKLIGPNTLASTVLADEVTVFTDHIHVRVQVQGESGMRANGKYFAIYRVGWQGMTPQLSAASSADGAVVLTAVDTDGNTMAQMGSATAPHWTTTWLHVQAGKAQPGGKIGVVSRAPNHFDAFVVGGDHQVYTAATGGAGWGGWWVIPGVNAVQGSPISALSRNLNKLDIFLADDQGRILSAAWEPSFDRWHGWWHILNGLTAPGGAVSGVVRRLDYLDIFTVGIDGNVHTASWHPGAAWGGWWRVGALQAIPGSPIAGISRSTDKLDIFLADDQGRILSAAWEPGFSQWHGWWHILNGLTAPGGAVAAVSRNADLIDIFTVGIDGFVYTAAWAPGAGWRGWWMLPGVQCRSGSSIVALSPQRDLLLVVVTTTDGEMMSTSWQPHTTGWTSWVRIS